MIEPISVVVLTKDEAANVADCLGAMLAQLRPGDEILVVDSASRDRTVALVEQIASANPDAVRLIASPTNLSFGAARNLGVGLARTEIIAFVSADAVPEPGWIDALRSAIANADVVYGRQRHSPTVRNAATVSRGLRYHHFEGEAPGLPERYASNVNAAYRRAVFSEIQFDEGAAGAEDVAFAKEARFAGLRMAYSPEAIVRHKDVASWKGEWRKHAREGEARAQLRRLLGTPVTHLVWAFAVGLLGVATVMQRSPALLTITLIVFFTPTLRRAASPVSRTYPVRALLAGIAASPLFDFVFIAHYLRKRMIP